MRNEYVSTILHTAILITRNLTGKRSFSMRPEYEIIGEESSGRVNYAIKKILDDLLEEIICITEGMQN